jgi:hypothetical protein
MYFFCEYYMCLKDLTLQFLKGLSHEMDLTFDEMYGQVTGLGLNRGWSHILNFLGAPMIL